MSVSILSPPSRPVLRDEIARDLATAIISGDPRPGERLVEGRIARELGVSQAPVREALQRLREAGLVVYEPRRGHTVWTPSADDRRNLHEMRMALEPAAIELAVARFRAEDAAPLEALIEQMAEAEARGDAVMNSGFDMEFHERICALSGNPYLLEARQRISLRIRVMHLLVTRDPSHLGGGNTPRKHRVLLDALRSGDPVAARREMIDHLPWHGAFGPVQAQTGASALQRL